MLMCSDITYIFFDIIGPGMTNLCSILFSDNNFFLFRLLSEPVSDLFLSIELEMCVKRSRSSFIFLKIGCGEAEI